LELFSQAIELDPTYARAYIGLADSYSILRFLNILPPKEAFGNAQSAVMKALEIEPDINEAHASLAYTNLYTWKWKKSEEGFKKAIRLDPGYSTAHQWYGNLLCALNRLDEARREFGIARQLDPLSLIINTGEAWSYYYSRMYEDAAKKFRRTLEMDPSFPPAVLWLARTYEQVGRIEESISILERLMTFEDTPNTLTSFAALMAKANRPERAKELLDRTFAMARTRYVSAYDVSEAYIALGDFDAAFEWLERSYQEGARGTALILVEPKLDPIRSDPRFIALVKSMELA
jgi:tetratricopeptide (TPR) repeat protein